MVIKRVFNNNVAMVTSDDGAELIVIGRGLCFGRHAGDVVDSSSVERTYALCESTANDARALDRLSSLIETIPVINLAISEDIVEMLREELDVNVDDAILIALADHITLALDRERKGVPCDNPLLLEIQQFYRKEYGLAGRALQIIKDYLGIQMSDEERGFITLHIVNATMPQRADRLIVSVQLVRRPCHRLRPLCNGPRRHVAALRALRPPPAVLCAACARPQGRPGAGRRSLLDRAKQLSEGFLVLGGYSRSLARLLWRERDRCREELSRISHC